jgi:hypothetical protein
MARHSFPYAPLALAFVLAGALPVRAEQVLVIDKTYTATADNTMDSHFRIDPGDGAPDAPANWSAPVNYAGGSVHVRFEVVTKPSAAVTLLNVCFEGTPNYACMPYSDPYTTTGEYDFEYTFASFYQHDMVNWSMGVKKIPFILKRENQEKPQGDPDFYPTKMHVRLWLITQGAAFVPPQDVPEVDAGTDAGTPDAGEVAMHDDAGMSAPDASISVPVPDAGSGIKPPTAGSGGMSSMTPPGPPTAGSGGAAPTTSGSGGVASTTAPTVLTGGGDDGGCSVQHAHSNQRLNLSAWCSLGIAVLYARRRRRAR